MASPSVSDGLRLEAQGLGARLAGGVRPVFDEVDLRVAAGECLLVRGPSGSGKSMLLRALAGCLPPGALLHGRLRRSGARPALLRQALDGQLLTTTVAEEVDFGLRLQRLPAALRARRSAEALAAAGLEGFGHRPLDALSAGESQRVLLAALLALRPGVLLLDEPTHALDAAGRRALVAWLRARKEEGLALVVADHVLGPWRTLADHHLVLKEGRPSQAPPDESCPPTPRPSPPPASGAATGRSARPVLHMRGVGLRDARGRPVLRDVSLVVGPGERLRIAGPNGSGKSTLLRLAAGLLSPDAGRVEGPRDPVRGAAAGRVALILQSPQANLFAPTAFDEVAFSMRRRGLPEAAIEARVGGLLAALGLEELAARSPFQLSFGEQHRLAVAAALAPEPALVLLDEPFAGLDPDARGALVALVTREQVRTGSAVLLASHDGDAVPDFAAPTLRLAPGRRRDG